MSTHTKAIERELDDHLRHLNMLEEEQRDLDRKRRALSERVSKAEGEAQKLRLALFALQGEHQRNLGDANTANHKRRIELKREA